MHFSRFCFSLLVIPVATAFADRHFNVLNSCPSSITLFINGVTQGLLLPGGTFQTTFADWWSGFFYTNGNGGNQNGTGTTRAGFYGEDNYYYIVVDPTHFNVGITIRPIIRATRTGFCSSDSCASVTCNTAYQQPPTAFPPPTTIAPAPPLYACPTNGTGYTIEFCPGGTFPVNNLVRIGAH